MAGVEQRVQNFIARGKQSLECGKVKLALEMFKQALALAPKSIEARKNLRAAQILAFKQEAPSKTSLAFKKLKLFFAASKASSLTKKGKGLEAMDEAEKLLEVDPLDPKYIDIAVKAAEAASLPEAAAVTIEAAYTCGDASDRSLLEKVATYYILAKKYEKARDAYKKILAASPSDQRILQLLKNTEAQLTIASGWEQNAGKQGGTRDLLANPEQAAQLDKQNAAQLVGDDVDLAAKEYLQRLAANPSDMNASRALARIYLKAKRFQEAIKVLEKATAGTSDPELDKMLSGAKLSAFDAIIEERKKRNEDYATIQAERDQFELDDLMSRVERYPNDMHLRYELGSLQVKYEYYDEAIKHLQIAQKSPKDRLEALYLLAKCFIAKGQRDLGVMQLETAKDAIPTMTDLKKRVIYQLALCAEDSGDDKKAYEFYKEIYSNDVTFEDVESRLMTVKKILDMNPKKTENLEV